jgi:DNA replication and repair protein RecF
MHLSALRLSNYRNFTEQRLDIPPAGLAIIGDNGHGKTNFLEAIYYLEIFRSFRGTADEQLVRFGEDYFRVEGVVDRWDGSGPHRVAAAFDRRQKKKKVTVDGIEPPRLGDAIGRVGAVIFSPSDVSIVAGSPATRRRFLDILLSLTESRYLEDLQRYRQALAQRNALLRAGEPAALVAAWNDGLIRAGSKITAARWRWVSSRSDAFAEQVRRIAGTGDAALEYEPSVGFEESETVPDPAVIAEAFATELARVADRERRQGATVVGPHRDDLRLRAASAGKEWIDLRVFGSGGQQRTAAVALRIVEGETLRDHLGSEPIILLDDVFAELDAGRSRRILEWVDAEERAQVILTAPKASDLDLRGRSLPTWRIENGRISGVES